MTTRISDWQGGIHGVSVKTFGAKGDGITDDTAAIQAAADACTGILYFSPGTYNLSATISITHNTILKGAGIDVTTIVMTSNAVLRHAFDVVGTVGEFLAFDFTIKTTTNCTTYYTMKAFNADGMTAWTPPANSLVGMERVKIQGWNFGMYVCGWYGGSSKVWKAFARNCHSNTYSDGVNLGSIFVGQDLLSYEVRNCYSNNNGSGDHNIYAICCRDVDIHQNEFTGSWSQALKCIGNIDATGHTALGRWSVTKNYFHNNQCAALFNVPIGYTLPHIQYTDNHHDTDTQGTDGGTVLVAINASAALRYADLRRNTFLNSNAGCLYIYGMGTIDYVDCSDTYAYNWSVGNPNNYAAVLDGTGGTKRFIRLSGFFDGNNKGLQAETLSVSGIFTYRQIENVVEVNCSGSSQINGPLMNTATITGASGATGYLHPLYLGSYAFWVASNGKLYLKNGTPTSDTDGTVVGSQS